MATFLATANLESFSDLGRVDIVRYDGGPLSIQLPSPFFNGATWLSGSASFTADSAFFNQMLGIIGSFGQGQYDFIIRQNNVVDYSLSNAPVQINMDAVTSTGRGGFAEGDTLLAITEVIGSGFNDVIRGGDPLPAPTPIIVINGVNHPFENSFFLTANPGEDVLVGGGGSDVLEGRGGADVLIGGTFTSDFAFDFASYESSPAAVTVRLNGVGSDTQTAIATGGDAAGDVLTGIEGLIGSSHEDRLTGNTLHNVLAGGLDSDVLDGKGGVDTADYSRDHFFDVGDTADLVNVHLGLNGADGTAAEFLENPGSNGTSFTQVSIDTLRNIENVTGTNGRDELVGNEQDNVLDGRGGGDIIDGGFGNDTLIGGGGINVVSFDSHDSNFVFLSETNTITLGLNGADGSFIRTEFGGLNGPVVAERDVLRGFQNVLGSDRTETINGNEQDNVIVPRSGNDRVNAGAGNDTYVFSSFGSSRDLLQGNDTYFDESGSDRIQVRSFLDITNAQRVGNDLVVTMTNGSFRIIDHFSGHSIENIADPTGTMVLAKGLIGGNGSGIIAGGNGGETLDGAGGDDFLFGGNGRDRLIGGVGNDRLTGGHGHDTFVFGPGFGHDVVTDFSHADTIEFEDGTFDNFKEVLSAAHQVGSDVLITLDADNSILLAGVDIRSLHASDFHF